MLLFPVWEEGLCITYSTVKRRAARVGDARTHNRNSNSKILSHSHLLFLKDTHSLVSCTYSVCSCFRSPLLMLSYYRVSRESVYSTTTCMEYGDIPFRKSINTCIRNAASQWSHPTQYTATRLPWRAVPLQRLLGRRSANPPSLVFTERRLRPFRSSFRSTPQWRVHSSTRNTNGAIDSCIEVYTTVRQEFEIWQHCFYKITAGTYWKP